MNRTRYFWARQYFCLVMILSVVLVLSSGKVGLATEDESVQHFKMLSSVEYAGKSQFKNLVETLFTVREQPLSDDKVQYFISTNGQQSSFKELSFVIDRKSRHLSETDRDLSFLERVNNQCVRSIKKVTKKDVGKTWNQSFKLSSLSASLPSEVKFTLTAVKLKTKVFGEMVMVRALSEPFVVKTAKESGGTESIQSRINAAYLFDPEIEEIYLSISVFEATKTEGTFSKERLRHEIATYRTDAAGVPADLRGLDKSFEKLVRKVGLTKKSVKVTKESPLPQWARSEGLGAAQVANICASVACEGALNPVATVCMPAARTVALQSAGRLASVSALGTVSGALAKSIPALGTMKIAVAPAFMGVGLGTAGAVGAGVAIPVATAGGGRSSTASP
jgi:hypothetical protein